MGLFAGTPLDRPPHCEDCGQLESECQCPPPAPFRLEPAKQTARLAVEKRKKGKTVTVIRGLPADGNDLPSLLTQLKNTCGAGGTMDQETIEIQGKHISAVKRHLQGIGFKVKP